jgi:hypothetical protein
MATSSVQSLAYVMLMQPSSQMNQELLQMWPWLKLEACFLLAYAV